MSEMTNIKYPLISDADSSLKEIVVHRAEELYGYPLPDEISDRIEWELQAVKNAGNASIYLLLKKAVEGAGLQPEEMIVENAAGNSFLLYLCGIGDVNPVEYGMPPERTYGVKQDKPLSINLEVPVELQDSIIMRLEQSEGVEAAIHPGVSAVVPGVMAQTGMETAEIVHGIVKETKPDMIMVVDALAARSTKRLNRTIQISDAGIHPGAGVGNHRSGITKESMGIPVIAIGVPTVVDAATIVNDTMENFIAALETSETLKGVGVVLQGYNSAEKYELVKELISPHLNGMFVTPKDIDETIRRISYTISEALNLLFTGNVEKTEERIKETACS